MIYLLLPTFNEAPGIERLLKNISAHFETTKQPYSVIVVNDGSTDDTPAILKNLQPKLNLQILNHKKNLGLGDAMKTGINYISAVIAEGDILITMDADNTHPVNLIPQLVKNVQAGSDIVIASRYTGGGKEIGLNKIRKILSSVASAILKFLFPVKNVNDYTSGCRAYSGKIIRQAANTYPFGKNLITQAGFTCMAEILIKLSKLTAEIYEVGLVLRYDLKRGKSKIKILKTIFAYFKMIVRLKLEKF